MMQAFYANIHDFSQLMFGLDDTAKRHFLTFTGQALDIDIWGQGRKNQECDIEGRKVQAGYMANFEDNVGTNIIETINKFSDNEQVREYVREKVTKTDNYQSDCDTLLNAVYAPRTITIAPFLGNNTFDGSEIADKVARNKDYIDKGMLRSDTEYGLDEIDHMKGKPPEYIFRPYDCEKLTESLRKDILHCKSYEDKKALFDKKDSWIYSKLQSYIDNHYKNQECFSKNFQNHLYYKYLETRNDLGE